MIFDGLKNLHLHLLGRHPQELLQAVHRDVHRIMNLSPPLLLILDDYDLDGLKDQEGIILGLVQKAFLQDWPGLGQQHGNQDGGLTRLQVRLRALGNRSLDANHLAVLWVPLDLLQLIGILSVRLLEPSLWRPIQGWQVSQPRELGLAQAIRDLWQIYFPHSQPLSLLEVSEFRVHVPKNGSYYA